MTDLAHIAPRHEAIDRRLTEWSRWVRVHPKAMSMQPMFRYARSNARQWEVDPPIHIEINTLAAHEVEKAVSALPEKTKTVIRWFYVFYSIPVWKIRRGLGLTESGICDLLTDGRDILKNTLKA